MMSEKKMCQNLANMICVYRQMGVCDQFAYRFNEECTDLPERHKDKIERLCAYLQISSNPKDTLGERLLIEIIKRYRL